MKSLPLKILNFKTLFLNLIIAISPIFGFSQTYQTVQSGDWDDVCTWSLTCNLNSVPPNPVPANVEILIGYGHDVILDGNLDFAGSGNKESKLKICGNLTITGNLDVAAKFKLEVCDGAKFVIMGDFNVRPGAVFTLDGLAFVMGELTFSNPNQMPTFNGSAYLYVGTNCDQYDTPGSSYNNDNIICGDPLPVDLLFFNRVLKPDGIILNWTTGSEINNDYFTLERSRDLYGWDVLGFVEGAGNSSVPLDYSFSDYRPLDGLAYYRLKQTDFDGKFKYYGPIAAHYDLGMEGLDFKVMKNFSSWVIAVPNDGFYQVEVYNLQGHRLHSERVENTLSIPAPEGAVVIRVTDGFERSASRVVM